jgi:hypothetical protein
MEGKELGPDLLTEGFKPWSILTGRAEFVAFFNRRCK